MRAEGRQQELAIRTALGADRRRIAADLLFEHGRVPLRVLVIAVTVS